MRREVLWGHSVDEYREMFALANVDRASRWLEYGCGASAVNSELHAGGMSLVSCDPLFVLDEESLSQRVSKVFEERVVRIREGKDAYDFSDHGGLDSFIAKRRQGVKQFLQDYALGSAEHRYLADAGDKLPFRDFTFDLALSSHYLFFKEDLVTLLGAIRELARVAKEVRIFPLTDGDGQPSPMLGPVLLGLQKENYGVEVRDVVYHVQPKANAMLRVWAQQCPLG